MVGILGALNINDGAVLLNTVAGERVVFDIAQRYYGEHNADVQAFLSLFRGETTSDHTMRYKLPGGGRLQRRGSQAQSAAVKAVGEWDVAFPIEDFGAQIAYDDISYAYLTAQEFARHTETVRIQDMNTVRFEVKRAIYNNNTRTFIDPRKGSLNIRPLANGDATLYPPVIGSETEATDNHYLVSNYAAADISDVNNPFVTLRDEIEEHFGDGNIVAFINPAQQAKTEALADFVPVSDPYITRGANSDTLSGVPDNVPGKIIGRVSGVWVSVWRWVEVGYIEALDADQPGPLIERVDPVETGLARGLTLVQTDKEFPFTSAHYRHRFGFGVGNRLSAAIMQLKASGSYDIPAKYA